MENTPLKDDAPNEQNNLRNNSGSNPVGAKKKYPYLYTATELLSMKEDKIPYLWENFISRQGIAATVGASDVGKSSLLRHLSLHIVQGKADFLGHKLNVRHRRVIYFSTEDNQHSINALLKKQVDKNVNPVDLKGLGYIFNADKPFEVIEEQLKSEPTDLVIIDAYSDILDGNSNDIGTVRKFLNKFQKLSLDYNCAIMFLHHTGKRTELGTVSKNNIIGSQGFEAKMRSVLDLRKMDGNPNRFLQVTKGNYLPEDIKAKAMELTFNDKQEFGFTGNHVSTNPVAIKSKFSEEDKIAIMVEVNSLLEKKLSIDKIREELLEMDFPEVPSKGTLHKWINENKNGQSGESVS